VYVAPLAAPSKRTLLTRSAGVVLYTPGGDGKDYLLSQSEDTLVAREFNITKLTLGPPRPLVTQVGTFGISAATSPGGVLLYPGGARASRLTWLDRAGKTLDVLAAPDRTYGAFRLSPDGKRFVGARSVSAGPPPTTDLWLMDVGRRVFSLFVPTSNGFRYDSAVWSSDGRTVIFNKSSNKGSGVFRKDITASGEGERIAEWRMRRLCDWSRDGRYLLFETYTPNTKRDLSVVSMMPDGRLAEGAEPQPYLHGPFAEWHGRFSPEPNPRWVAYQSDETGRNEIYIASFPDARRRLQVTSDGGIYPQWDPDGRELFYLSGNGMLTVVGLRNGPDGLELSSPQQLFPLAARSFIASPYEISPDGKRILVNQAEQNSELHVVVNWPLLLKRQAAQ